MFQQPGRRVLNLDLDGKGSGFLGKLMSLKYIRSLHLLEKYLVVNNLPFEKGQK